MRKNATPLDQQATISPVSSSWPKSELAACKALASKGANDMQPFELSFRSIWSKEINGDFSFTGGRKN